MLLFLDRSAVAVRSRRVMKGPRSPKGRLLGVACLRRSGSDDESSQVSDPHVWKWKARGGRSVGSIHDRGISRWTCREDTTLSGLIRRWLDLVREDLAPSTFGGSACST